MDRLEFIKSLLVAPFVSIFGSKETYEKTKNIHCVVTELTDFHSEHRGDFQYHMEIFACHGDGKFTNLDDVYNYYIKAHPIICDKVVRKHNKVIVYSPDGEYSKNRQCVYTNDRSLIIEHIK